MLSSGKETDMIVLDRLQNGYYGNDRSGNAYIDAYFNPETHNPYPLLIRLWKTFLLKLKSSINVTIITLIGYYGYNNPY